MYTFRVSSLVYNGCSISWTRTWRTQLSLRGRETMTDIFKHNFFNENVWILIAISLQFVLKGPVNNIPALVQIVAWCPPGDKPLSEPIMISLLTHICITRPQWVNIAMPLTAAKHNKVHTCSRVLTVLLLVYSCGDICPYTFRTQGQIRKLSSFKLFATASHVAQWCWDQFVSSVCFR